MDKETIARIRLFNRYYTSVLGLLDRHYLNSDFSLTETRIMFELYHQPKGLTASELIDLLHMDKGYLSRILQMFEKKKLVEKKRSDDDGRSFHLFLSPAGVSVFSKLNEAAEMLTAQMLDPLSEKETNQLVAHMEAIRQILSRSNTHDK